MITAICKRSAILFFNFFISYCLMAQNSIIGKIIDHNSNLVANTNILLLNHVDSALIKGTTTNHTGTFSFQNIAEGKYLISCSYIGFETMYLPEINVSTKNLSVDIGTITLKTETVNLKTVSVVTKKPLFEQKIDRMVVNVKNSITSIGGTVIDVLQKSPGVTVNKQAGTISMNGKNGVMIMINGKINYMPAEAVVQMLSGMSANNVERIELITTPPAKYDAEGNAGYINIVLLDNPDIGFNGSYSITVAAFYGTSPSANFNFNYRTKKANLYGSYSFIRMDKITTRTVDNYRKIIHQGKITETNSNSNRDAVRLTHNIRLGYDYQIGKKTTLGLLASAYDNKWTMKAKNNLYKQVNNIPDTNITVNNEEINQWKHWMGNINLQHNISSEEDISFNMDYLYYDDNNPNSYFNQYYNSANQLLSTENTRSAKKTVIKILPAQVDYKKKLSAKADLETGIKTVTSKFTNDVSVENLIQSLWKADSSLTAVYFLKENISAAYASVKITASERTNIKAGLRYEYTSSNLHTKTQKNIVDKKYGKLFPTFYISHKLNDHNSINFSYNRRINRPAFTDLAPFTIFLDPYTFITGNSALQPSIADALKADYVFKKMIFSLGYTFESNSIAAYQTEVNVSSNKQYITTQNFKSIQNINASFSLPFTINNWWFSQLNVNSIWQKIDADYKQKPLSITNFNYNISGFQSFTLHKNFAIELSGFYQSAGLLGTSVARSFGQLNAGMQKKFVNNNSSLKFGVDDIFSTMKWRWTLDLPKENFYTNMNIQLSRRIFKLTYSKNFGNKALKDKRTRITASEEERLRVK
jgi:hypothetical protein